MHQTISRRDCMKMLGASSLMLPLLDLQAFISEVGAAPFFTKGIHLFSKHLQWLSYHEMAGIAKEMGFAGIDLTVRPKGHVLPEQVETELPKAVKAIRKAGLKAELITTAITGANEKHTEQILKTASALGIKYYRMGWLKYQDQRPVAEQLESYKKQFKELEQMNEHYNIHGAYQNHAGSNLGSSVWDLWLLLKDLNPQWIGCRFDIRHAMVEGMNSWKLALELLKDHIKSVDLKDFRYWQKEQKWGIENMPVGEGIINFDGFFKKLLELNLNVPFTLHAEYELGGADKGATQLTWPPEKIKQALNADLEKLTALMNNNKIKGNQ